MTDEAPLGPGAEFDMIRAMLERWGPRANGVGDDAAIVHVPRGDVLLASVDTAVETQHFRREWLTPRELGYRAVAAALSDLAAMAARPLGVLVAMTVPDAWLGDVAGIADGIGEAVAAVRTPVLGGNLSAGGELSITTTVLGSAFAPLRRTTARAGDIVYVTGSLGGVAEALRRLEHGGRGEPGGPGGPQRERFAHPTPRLAEARWLAERGATAAIDISDGLLADVRHLAAASRVAIAIDGAAVPCMPGVSHETAQHSGEEYELVVTASAPIDVKEFARLFGLPLTEIGTVSAGEPGVTVDGQRVAASAGYDHFSR